MGAANVLGYGLVVELKYIHLAVDGLTQSIGRDQHAGEADEGRGLLQHMHPFEEVLLTDVGEAEFDGGLVEIAQLIALLDRGPWQHLTRGDLDVYLLRPHLIDLEQTRGRHLHG